MLVVDPSTTLAPSGTAGAVDAGHPGEGGDVGGAAVFDREDRAGFEVDGRDRSGLDVAWLDGHLTRSERARRSRCARPENARGRA